MGPLLCADAFSFQNCLNGRSWEPKVSGTITGSVREVHRQFEICNLCYFTQPSLQRDEEPIMGFHLYINMGTDIQIELTPSLTNKVLLLFKMTFRSTVCKTFPINHIWESQVHNQFPSLSL